MEENKIIKIQITVTEGQLAPLHFAEEWVNLWLSLLHLLT